MDRRPRAAHRTIVGLLVATVLVIAPAIGAGAVPSGVVAKTTLVTGQSYYSPTGVYHVVMQSDGNLVLYLTRGKAVWSSRTSGHPGARAVMQSDGNLVVYLSTKPLWSSHTGGHTGATLQIANDGRLIIHSTTGVVLWQSGAALPTPTITDQTGHTCSANTYGTLTDFITHAKCVPPLESAADKQFGVFTVERSNHVRAGFFNDGCSGIGKLTQNPYPGYEHVCDIHDYMYLLIAHFGQGNESVYGNLRAQADQIFQKELYSICSTYSGLQSAIGVTCRRTADTYYCTVRGFGNPSDAAAADEGKLSLDPTFVPVGTKCP